MYLKKYFFEAPRFDFPHMFYGPLREGEDPRDMMGSCWTERLVFSQALLAEHRAAFEQADVRLLWISQALEKQHGRVEPSLRTLGAEATKRAARC